MADVAQIMPYYGGNARPFIISLDGWAGTQRYASVWSGDQTGGEWEYIRFHIPTFIGAGLRYLQHHMRQRAVSSAERSNRQHARIRMEGFTAMGLNMDGWGSNAKYPHILGEPVTSVNRW